MWMQVRNVPPAEPSWRDSDEAQMQNLKEEDITIRETALGRERVRQQEDAINCLAAMTEEERTARNLPSSVLEALKGVVEVAEV